MRWLSDHFHKSHDLYSTNGKFMEIAKNSVMSIKKSPKFMDSICGTVVNKLVKESVYVAGPPKMGVLYFQERQPLIK